MVTWPMTSRDPQRCCDCEAVLSAILFLAAAWLLVKKVSTTTLPIQLVTLIVERCHTLKVGIRQRESISSGFKATQKSSFWSLVACKSHSLFFVVRSWFSPRTARVSYLPCLIITGNRHRLQRTFRFDAKVSECRERCNVNWRNVMDRQTYGRKDTVHWRTLKIANWAMITWCCESTARSMELITAEHRRLELCTTLQLT